MYKTLFLLLFTLGLTANASNPNFDSQDRDDLTLAVSYTTYDFDQNTMQIIFANLNDTKIKYKIFSDTERLKSVGGFETEAGINTVDIDISYYETGNYILEMNDGETETVYYFNVDRPKTESVSKQ